MGLNEKCAIVCIGRNEKSRLEKTLASYVQSSLPVLYVDSASEDGSVEFIKKKFPQVLILELNARSRLCAALARNKGFQKILEIYPSLEYVQFLDADCVLANGWLERGVEYLVANSALGAVCGYTKEENPHAHFFARIQSLEWDRKVGPIFATTGTFLVRTEVFKECKGFREFFLAAEDDDFFSRMLNKHYGLERLDVDMCYHDIGSISLIQWLKRAKRGGMSFALCSVYLPFPSRIKAKRKVQKTLFWSFFVPMLFFLGFFHQIFFLVPLLFYFLNFLKSFFFEFTSRGLSFSEALLYAVVCLISKWPAGIGVIQVYLAIYFNKSEHLISSNSSYK